MTQMPRFIFHQKEDGSIRILRGDGNDCTEEDLAFVKRSINYGSRGESLRAASLYRESLQREAEGDTTPIKGFRFQIDHLDLALETERKRQGLKRAAVARAMFIAAHKLTDYVTGRSRPSQETRRAWGYVLGLRLMWIPIEIESNVKNMVQLWREQDTVRRLREEDAA